ncbi:MAG: hypothetical protein K1060chlam1_01166 [Candidatus Anoxychlamydiales bacterium]|nr:hypothetical protein [Candidatus Anoxychlamydiales bacterium]
MTLPSSFSSNPDQDPHKYFKNLLIDFKKEIKAAVDPDALEEKMSMIINASKEMLYKDNHKKAIFHKPETKKALDKVWTEFDRYILTIQKNPSEANCQDLLNAVEMVETLIDENDIY